jgi:glutathione S-transferase
MFGAKVQIATLEKGLDFDLVMVEYGSQRGYDPKHPDVLRINPKRQVPVLVQGDLELFDSNRDQIGSSNGGKSLIDRSQNQR